MKIHEAATLILDTYRELKINEVKAGHNPDLVPLANVLFADGGHVVMPILKRDNLIPVLISTLSARPAQPIFIAVVQDTYFKVWPDNTSTREKIAAHRHGDLATAFESGDPSVLEALSLVITDATGLRKDLLVQPYTRSKRKLDFQEIESHYDLIDGATIAAIVQALRQFLSIRN